MAASSNAACLPTDDAYIDFNNPSNTFNDSELQLNYSALFGFGSAREIYLKFNLSCAPQTSRALLLLNITANGIENGATLDVSLHSVSDDTWTESTVNVNNAPDPSVSALQTIQVTDATTGTLTFGDPNSTNPVGTYIENERTGDGTASFLLRFSAGTGTSFGGNLVFSSSEGSSTPFISACGIGTATWTGATNNDWHTATNWDSGCVPEIGTDVTIPNGSTVELSANAETKSITNTNGATLNLSTFDLTVEETVTNNGILEQTKDVPDGSTTSILHIQNRAGDQTQYYGVDITPSGGTALGSTIVRIFGNQDCTIGADSTVQRCFNINPTNEMSATIRYWLLPSELFSKLLTNLQVWDWNGTWTAVGDTATYGGDNTCSGGAATCWYQYSNIAAFSPHVGNDSQPASPPVAPLSVSLASFEAKARNDNILVTWQTASEFNNVGFNLLRSTSLDALGTPVNSELIPSQAQGSGQGASYQWVDDEVESSVVYYYWLEDVDTNGVTTLHGPVSAEIIQPSAVQLVGLQSTNSTALWQGILVSVTGLLAGSYVWRRRRTR